MESYLLCWLIPVFVQIVFFLLFVLASRRSPVSPHTVSASVIICARNEEENLRELLPMLFSQDHPDFEVIVVNDRSSDGTREFLESLTATGIPLKVVTIEETPPHVNPKKYALTLGIKVAAFDTLLFTDADCRPATPGWIRAMTGLFAEEKTQIVLGYSPYYRGKGLLGAFISYETLLTGLQYLSLARMGLPYMGVGRNLAYRKSFFMERKGFRGNTAVTGGDDDLFVNANATAKNTKVCTAGGSQVYSVPVDSWRAFLNQKIRHLSVGKRYRMVHRFILGIFVLTHVLTWAGALALLFVTQNFLILFGVLTGRALLVTLVCRNAVKNLGDRTPVILIPVLDFIFAIYYPLAASISVFTKKVRWKN